MILMLIPAIAALLLVGAHFALPIGAAVAFAWSVDFRRALWTPRDYLVTALLATSGCWSFLVILVAVLAGAALPDTPIGEFSRRGVHAGVLALGLAPMSLMGGAALGRVRAGALMVGVAGVLAFLAAALPAWLGGFAAGLVVWHALLLALLTLDAGAARRAYELVGRCPMCGYSLHGLLAAQCPECGSPMHCRSCGYNLGGLRPGAPCPECGASAIPCGERPGTGARQ